MSSQPLHPALLIGLILTSGCQGCSETTLRPTDVDTGEAAVPFTNDWGQWLAMDAMPDGSPALAYYDATTGGVGFAIARFAEDGSVSWQREPVDGYAEDNLDPGDRGKYVSMVISADGVVWLAYQDVSLKTLRYAQRAKNGDWTNGIADAGGGPTSDAGYYSDITLDGNGDPVIVHFDNARGTLRVVRWTGDSFSGSVLSEREDAIIGEFPKIVIASNVEYVVFYDRTEGDLLLSYGGAGSHTVEIIESEGDIGQWPDVAIEDGTLFIAHHDVGNQDLRFVRGEPGIWEAELIDDGEFVGGDPAIYFAEGGPGIAYCDGRNNDVKLALRQSGSWTVDQLIGDDGALGYHNEVVTTSLGTFVASYDYTERTVWFNAL
ncbi:MAG: hypothetical protein AAFV53_09525 [Myxococcota bacterium]